MKKELDGQRFAACLVSCGEMFSKTLSKEQLAGYFHALEDMHVECVIHGISECMKHEVRFPAPAKIREYGNNHRLKPAREEITYHSRGASNINANQVTEFGRCCCELLREVPIGTQNWYLTIVEIARHYDKPQMLKDAKEDLAIKMGAKV